MFDEPLYVQCGDARIACYIYGEGKPLVLLHGNGEDSAYFAAQIPVFAKEYRVIAVDARGHGKSDLGSRGLSFKQSAEDIKKVLDHLCISKAHILGFSDGGNLAIKFSLTYPACVDTLILNGANIRMLMGVKPQYQLMVYPEILLLSLAAPFSPKAYHCREVLALMAHNYGVDFSDLNSIKASALVIVGDNDMIRKKETDLIVRSLPNAGLVVISGVDHFCARQAPEQFNEAVLQFLHEMS